ncbi:RICIN domain-containing protein [Streptomyces sp. ISL-11]|uniref:RICIN domain-containing protein n=1 Tax=Streptomyces sp. ISL-11 TaxID=2819174 RepID=UPI001BE9FA97|nr:RICIN domain-containing protein [Streptomyces sp. ISL-11]MBT2384870.1 RICIN domain-containing protein [Streptomyces sp. ISL-11]
MGHPARATAAILGAAAVTLALAAPAAVADAPAPALRVHSGAYGGCLTAEGSAYHDPRGALRPWLVALQPCDRDVTPRQSWRYSPATHQYTSVDQPYRCIDRQGSLLVTALCDAGAAHQRFRPEPAAGDRRRIVSEADGRLWEQETHRCGTSRDATGEGVRAGLGAEGTSPAQRWRLSPA